MYGQRTIMIAITLIAKERVGKTFGRNIISGTAIRQINIIYGKLFSIKSSKFEHSERGILNNLLRERWHRVGIKT